MAEAVVLAELKAELQEAQLEIDRHHRDFQRIRWVLSKYPPGSYDGRTVGDLVRQIRNIVG